MSRTNVTAPHLFTAALKAIGDLCEDGFAQVHSLSGVEALMAHSAIEQAAVGQKTSPFFRSFVPFRKQMVALLADSYRLYFRLTLAHPNQTGDAPDEWAWTQLQPAVYAALEWMREWYILACEGENQSVRHVGQIEFVPGGTGSLSISTVAPAFLPPTAWRAPAWLFVLSPLVGVGPLKQHHVPAGNSEDRLGESHTRLILNGARRVFLWDLESAIGTVMKEEIAAAGAIRSEEVNAPIRGPIKRKGWEQRVKLYGVIKKVLSDNPNLQGMKFCAELDKRHAPPLFDWKKSREWPEDLTWKEAWRDKKLKTKIRRVRQEAKKAN